MTWAFETDFEFACTWRNWSASFAPFDPWCWAREAKLFGNPEWCCGPLIVNVHGRQRVSARQAEAVFTRGLGETRGRLFLLTRNPAIRIASIEDQSATRIAIKYS